MFLRGFFSPIVCLSVYLSLSGTIFAQEVPKVLKELSHQFDSACENLLKNRTDDAANALEDTMLLLTEQRENAKGRARKMMGNSIREIKRLKKDIGHNSLQSRLRRLETQYANAELGLKFHLKRTDPDFRMTDRRILGRNGLCVQGEG